MIVYVNRRTKRVVTAARFEQLIEEELSTGRSYDTIRKSFLDEWAGSVLEDARNESDCEFTSCKFNNKTCEAPEADHVVCMKSLAETALLG